MSLGHVQHLIFRQSPSLADRKETRREPFSLVLWYGWYCPHDPQRPCCVVCARSSQRNLIQCADLLCLELTRYTKEIWHRRTEVVHNLLSDVYCLISYPLDLPTPKLVRKRGYTTQDDCLTEHSAESVIVP